MQIAVRFTSYYESFSNLFMTVKSQCPLFAEYQALYSSSTRLQSALCDFHAAIIRCCKHVIEVTQRSCAAKFVSTAMLVSDLSQGRNI